jgi:hypothetical protein
VLPVDRHRERITSCQPALKLVDQTPLQSVVAAEAGG